MKNRRTDNAAEFDVLVVGARHMVDVRRQVSEALEDFITRDASNAPILYFNVLAIMQQEIIEAVELFLAMVCAIVCHPVPRCKFLEFFQPA